MSGGSLNFQTFNIQRSTFHDVTSCSFSIYNNLTWFLSRFSTCFYDQPRYDSIYATTSRPIKCELMPRCSSHLSALSICICQLRPVFHIRTRYLLQTLHGRIKDSLRPFCHVRTSYPPQTLRGRIKDNLHPFCHVRTPYPSKIPRGHIKDSQLRPVCHVRTPYPPKILRGRIHGFKDSQLQYHPAMNLCYTFPTMSWIMNWPWRNCSPEFLLQPSKATWMAWGLTEQLPVTLARYPAFPRCV